MRTRIVSHRTRPSRRPRPFRVVVKDTRRDKRSVPLLDAAGFHRELGLVIAREPRESAGLAIYIDDRSNECAFGSKGLHDCLAGWPFLVAAGLVPDRVKQDQWDFTRGREQDKPR